MQTSNIFILGDVCPEWGFPKDGAARHDALEGIAGIIKDADYCAANLEAPVTAHTKKLNKNSVCLKGQPGDIAILKSAGIRAVALANNHILDYEEQGLLDTLKEAQETGISTYGAGTVEDAKAPHIKEINGMRIGFLAFAEEEFNCAEENRIGANRWDDLDSPDVIRAAKKQCDWLIVQYHGGIEHYIYPSPLLQKKCRKMAECGADFVVCQHSHCIGTHEKWGNSEILYGQGNCIFGHEANNKMWNRGLIVHLSLGDTMDAAYIPIEATPEGERLSSPEDAEQILAELDKNSQNIADAHFIKQSWDAFCKKQKDMYLPLLFAWNRYANKLNRMLSGRLVGILTSHNTRKTVMNLLRCDAHREVLQTILENDYHAE